MKTYTELITFPTFEERFDYLKLNGVVSELTFGPHRHLNQNLYRSREWIRVRDLVLIRDGGFDLGLEDYPISGKMLVHHIEPITLEDLEASSPIVFDVNNLITTSLRTHNAIHYGTSRDLPKVFVERQPGDTKLW
jgi:hypothetical protein